MKHFYFFVSTDSKDEVSTISVFASSAKDALNLVKIQFKKHAYKGEPKLLAI